MLLAVLVTAIPANATDIIAHRGYSHSAAENSIQSVADAWRAGAHAVEVDVQVSADGVVYLFHDDEIANKRIDGLNIATIESLHSGRMPRLSDLLNVVPATGYYILDLKNDEPNRIDRILDVIDEFKPARVSVSFQSDDLAVLAYLRERSPSSRLAYLSHLKWKLPYLVHTTADDLLRELRELDVDTVSIKGRSFVDRRFVEKLKTAGWDVHVWTINDRDRATYYRELGVDGLITDNVGALIKR